MADFQAATYKEVSFFFLVTKDRRTEELFFSGTGFWSQQRELTPFHAAAMEKPRS